VKGIRNSYRKIRGEKSQPSFLTTNHDRERLTTRRAARLAFPGAEVLVRNAG
jgi:hypothetical protein